MRQRLHGFHLAQGGDAETLEQTDCWVLVWIQIKRQSKFHFSLNVSLIAFYFLVCLSVAVKNKTHSRSLMKAHVVCFQQNDFILGSYCHRLNPDDFFFFIQICDAGTGAPPWGVPVCHTVNVNVNHRSHRLRNPGLELRRASESSAATATAGEVLVQVGDQKCRTRGRV